MPSAGSTATTSRTRGAIGSASVPGPAPMSRTRIAGVSCRPAIVSATRGAYSSREDASYRRAFFSWLQRCRPSS